MSVHVILNTAAADPKPPQAEKKKSARLKFQPFRRYGTYIPKQKFNLIRIPVLHNIKKIWNKSITLKSYSTIIVYFFARTSGASPLSINTVIVKRSKLVKYFRHSTPILSKSS